MYSEENTGYYNYNFFFCIKKEVEKRIFFHIIRIPFYMSTDCENLLRKFLVLNPAKRASLETIMKDKWMNMGYEDDELKPYIEPMADLKDQKRIGKTGTVYNFINFSLTVVIFFGVIIIITFFDIYTYYYYIFNVDIHKHYIIIDVVVFIYINQSIFC